MAQIFLEPGDTVPQASVLLLKVVLRSAGTSTCCGSFSEVDICLGIIPVNPVICVGISGKLGTARPAFQHKELTRAGFFLPYMIFDA